MALEVRLERAELRGGLGEGDAERLHAARESSGPRAGQAPGRVARATTAEEAPD